jgi:hypothetical protein
MEDDLLKKLNQECAVPARTEEGNMEIKLTLLATYIDLLQVIQKGFQNEFGYGYQFDLRITDALRQAEQDHITLLKLWRKLA